MEWNLEKCNDGGYLLKTETFYDTVISGQNFIIAHDEKREELIFYDKNLNLIKRYDSIKTVKEYRFNEAVFALLNNHILLALDGENFTTSEIVDNFSEPVNCCEILCISSTKYLVIAEFKPENIEYYRFEFYIIDLSEEKPDARYITRCSHSYHLMGNYRFLECDNLRLYDLFTERNLELPKGKDLSFLVSKANLDILYSSEGFFVITFDNLFKLKLNDNENPYAFSSTVNYCLYINGKLVSILEGEEYEEILPRLQELSESTCRFKTLVIKDQLWIWTADNVPEAIPIFSFLKTK